MAFDIPILLIIYNRLDLVQQQFSILRALKPSTLFVAADGPNSSTPEDKRKTADCRAIFEQIDWPCELSLNFAQENQGCHTWIMHAIDWVFSEVEEAIILEDDIFPSPSFFPFMAENLARFKHDPSIHMIASYNHMVAFNDIEFSLIKTHYTSHWGWATWADRWQAFSSGHRSFDIEKGAQTLQSRMEDGSTKNYFQSLLKNRFLKPRFAWDYAWGLWILVNNGHCILPSQNLSNNLGFRPDATHTQTGRDLRGEYPIFQPSPEDLQNAPIIGADHALSKAYPAYFFYIECLLSIKNPRLWLLYHRNLDQMDIEPGLKEEIYIKLEIFRRPRFSLSILEHLLFFFPEDEDLINLRSSISRLISTP